MLQNFELYQALWMNMISQHFLIVVEVCIREAQVYINKQKQKGHKYPAAAIPFQPQN